MIRSKFINALAWVVIVVGAVAGLFVGVSTDSFVAVFAVWVSAFFFAVILFYFGASLHHLEQIHGNTSVLLQEVKKGEASSVVTPSLAQIGSKPAPAKEGASTQEENRCLLCGQKYNIDSTDSSGTCPECRILAY